MVNCQKIEIKLNSLAYLHVFIDNILILNVREVYPNTVRRGKGVVYSLYLFSLNIKIHTAVLKIYIYLKYKHLQLYVDSLPT